MIPRSFRNNNPFNIKKSSSRWYGKVKGNDKVFETFDSLEHGTRAGLKLLLNYVKQGNNTPRKIIERFAPSSENDTSTYLHFVCTPYFFSCDKVIVSIDEVISMALRIIQYESGLSSIELLDDYHIDRDYLVNIFFKYHLKLEL